MHDHTAGRHPAHHSDPVRGGSATAPSWRAAVSQWGDTLWRLALLLHNDVSAARAAVVRAFVHAYTTPSADPEAALVQALLAQRPRWQLPARRRLLPRPLARIAPSDRVLLALWLLQRLDGPRLALLSGAQPDALAARLAATLVPVLPRRDPARTPAGRAALIAWLAQQLGVPAPSTQPPTGEWQAAQVAWRAAVEQGRTLLQTAVGQQHLPVQVHAAIEDALSNPPEAASPPWWQQRSIQFGALAAGLALLLLLVIGPWRGQTTPPAAAAPPAAPELVQQTLDAWTTLPISGTLHRRVWAVDERLAKTPAVVTDLWLDAESLRHRIEVRHNDMLVEWQFADGVGRLLYAADSDYSACPWQDSSALDRRVRAYAVGPEQQQAVRDARLTLGAYGEGARFLEAALAATDLRSFGTQMVGDTSLVLLNYTDQHLPSPRKLLLAIDPIAHELQAVREIRGEGTQLMMRDLWRMEAQEVRPRGISTATPRWPHMTLQRNQLLDPTCPGLDPDHVVSLRTLANSSSDQYLPAKLPPGTTRAAMLSSTIVDRTAPEAVAARAVFIGPGHWLSLSAPQRTPHYRSGGIQQGSWDVTLREQQGRFTGALCKTTRFRGVGDPFCVPEIVIAARGWTYDELLAIIDMLEPVNPQTWIALGDFVLEPQPLSPQVRSVFVQAFTALQPREEGTLHTVFEESRRANPDRPARQDPYYVPLEVTNPERFQEQQWTVFSNNQVARSKQISTTPDGAVIAAELNDGVHIYRYHRAEGTLRVEPAEQAPWWDSTQWVIRGNEMLRSLWGSTQPITLIEEGSTWLLEQRSEVMRDRRSTGSAAGSWTYGAWIDDLPPGSIVQRLFIQRATALPQRFVVAHVDAYGHETLLYMIMLAEWRYLEDAPASDFFTLPPLPDDTLTIDRQARTISGTNFNLQVPSRVLMLPATTGAQIEQDHDILPSLFSSDRHNGYLMAAFFRPITELDHIGLLKATTYRLPPGDWRVTIRQGPRDLLRHNLRYQSALAPADNNETSSRAIEVTIAGQRRTAWLLENPNATPPAALVVEVDNLLLHISSPDTAYLEGSILAKLSELEWVEVER